MSNFTESEILAVAIKILEETGAMTTTELKEALMDEMNPSGNDLEINLNRNDTKFEQKVRNMVSHRDHNELLKYCEYERMGRNGLLRSKSLTKIEPEETESNEVKERKAKKRAFKARRVHYDEVTARNKQLGLKGELFVLQCEKGRLRPELSEKIIHVSVEEGDGAGYDILSYDSAGKPRFLEVKTTTGSIKTPFYLSENEKAFLVVYKEEAEVVRVYHFDETTNQGEIIRISGTEFFEKTKLDPIAYKVTLQDEN